MNNIEQTPPCIRGCTRKGTDEPMPARHGEYCNRCFYQYLRALQLAADLVEHVASLISYQARTEDKVDTSREAPVPFNLEAFNDANETYRRLAAWTEVWARHLGEPMPSTVGKVWRDGRGRIVGLRRGARPEQARHQTRHLTRWLTDRLDRILEAASRSQRVRDDVDYWRDELGKLYRVNARWPRESKPRYSDMPCPDCPGGTGHIAVFPPAAFGEDERIVCERCGRHFLPENYEFLIRVFQQVQKERESTARVARHLMRKHGIKAGSES